MDLLGWAVILLLVGLSLAILEVFVPSGGMLGFLSVTSILAALFLAFRHGPWSGLGFLGLALFAVPTGLVLALQVWPKTPMGKRILLPLPTSEDVLPHDQHLLELKKLVGRVGRAKTLMLPSGAIDVDGKTFDALSEGMAIEAGHWVKVVEVRGSRVVVRPTDRPHDAGARDEQLNRPIEELGLDPFDEPLDS